MIQGFYLLILGNMQCFAMLYIALIMKIFLDLKCVNTRKRLIFLIFRIVWIKNSENY